MPYLIDSIMFRGLEKIDEHHDQVCGAWNTRSAPYRQSAMS